MAVNPARVNVLALYKNLLRESSKFASYNYRLYFIRRVKDGFREGRSLEDPKQIATQLSKARSTLESLKRQLLRSSCEGDPEMAQQASAEAGPSTATVTLEPAAPTQEAEPTLRVQLHRPPNRRRVMWQKDTIDNENMGKKKSKCCCVYRKPHPFGESSSDEEDDCANCVGHRKPKSAAHHSAPEGAEGAGASQ